MPTLKPCQVGFARHRVLAQFSPVHDPHSPNEKRPGPDAVGPGPLYRAAPGPTLSHRNSSRQPRMEAGIASPLTALQTCHIPAG